MNASVDCPYCDAHLPRMLSRKMACRYCGQPTSVKITRSDRSKRLMTAAAQVEAAKVARRDDRGYQQDLRTLGTVDLAQRELERRKSRSAAPTAEAFARRRLLERIAQGSADPYERKMAALQAAWGAALAGDDDHLPYLCLLHSAQLEEIAAHAGRLGVRHVRIVASGPGGHCCAACKRMDGQVIAIESESTNPNLPVPGCACTPSGPAQTGFCLCYYEPVFDHEL